MIDDLFQGGESAVVIKASLVQLLRVEQGTQGRGYIAPRRTAIGLELVDADVCPVWRLEPGSVKIGGTWHVEHFAAPLNCVCPRRAASRRNCPLALSAPASRADRNAAPVASR